MEWITESKLFKGSKNQEKILAAVADPVNKPLVRQLTSYVDPEFAESLDDDESNLKPDGKKKMRPSSGGSFGGGRSQSFDSEGFEGEDAEPDLDLGEEAVSDEPGDVDIENEADTAESEQVEESTQVNQKSVNAATYVTVEQVSQAVNQIPGLLNLRDDTKGANYATLKGKSSSEFWVYFDSNVDINSILDKVNLVLSESGYYFFEFDRVSRDDNAIVFNINWVSNYFRPYQFLEEDDDES